MAPHAQADSWAPKPGALIGDFRILEAIEIDQVGAVLRAQQRQLDRDVVLKVIGPMAVERVPDLKARFSAQIARIKHLEHPNIVRLYDFGQSDEGLFWVAMELVRGHKLTDLLEADGPRQAVNVRELGLQLLSALVEAHEYGVIHPDLTPDRVMLARQGAGSNLVKLSGFASSASLGPFPGHTLAARPSKTGGRYSAPEKASGGASVGPHSDVFSAGLILFEMLVGKPALNRRSSSWNIEIPAWLFATPLGPVLERATRTQWTERYGSAYEFYNALEAISPGDLEDVVAPARADAGGPPPLPPPSRAKSGPTLDGPSDLHVFEEVSLSDILEIADEGEPATDGESAGISIGGLDASLGVREVPKPGEIEHPSGTLLAYPKPIPMDAIEAAVSEQEGTAAEAKSLDDTFDPSDLAVGGVMADILGGLEGQDGGDTDSGIVSLGTALKSTPADQSSPPVDDFLALDDAVDDGPTLLQDMNALRDEVEQHSVDISNNPSAPSEDLAIPPTLSAPPLADASRTERLASQPAATPLRHTDEESQWATQSAGGSQTVQLKSAPGVIDSLKGRYEDLDDRSRKIALGAGAGLVLLFIILLVVVFSGGDDDKAADGATDDGESEVAETSGEETQTSTSGVTPGEEGLAPTTGDDPEVDDDGAGGDPFETDPDGAGGQEDETGDTDTDAGVSAEGDDGTAELDPDSDGAGDAAELGDAETPPPVAEERTVLIDIVSRPTGARVMLGDAELCPTTPCTATVPYSKSSIEVVVTAQGHEPRGRTFKPNRDKTLKYTLKPSN